ncbi:MULTISPECIES: hypothetical protein [unclassified Streptomyces]|uniref:hypothetical protein n=1 Tax=unclassified Streptomyces TaxID=2593676 RepID=UPI0003675CD4|nr:MULTISPECIES: hypothetical protein [unclassified Streptomyces]MYX32412.1 hypothetical protein [Streptomyces sp. SID8377]
MPYVDLQALYAEFETRAFPRSWTEWGHGDLTVTSNESGHAIVLAESDEFWDDHDGSAAAAAGEHLASVYRNYEIAAAVVWGDPCPVDITNRLAGGETSPFTELLLEQGAISGNFWDRGERALGLAICQMDKETAIQVVAFVASIGELQK